jgi:peptidyl-prolyl cis-trans isomerase C
MTSNISPARLPALLKILLLIVALAGVFGVPAATTAQDSSSSSSEPPSSEEPLVPVLPGPDTVVATVNGETITEADLSFLQEDYAQQMSQMNPAQHRAFLLTQAISLKLMAGAAKTAGMADNDTYKRRLAYLSTRALSRAYILQEISSKVTKDAVQAEYDKTYAAASPDEIHVLHILVNTEEDAKAIKASLDAGGDFAALAKEKSTDPSAQQNSGDLGFVQSWAPLVKPFLDAAFALKDGETSGPVKSDFGWHIIRVTERRPATKPAFEQEAQQIAQQLFGAAYTSTVDSLRKAGTIDIADPDLKSLFDGLPPQ